MLRLDYVSCVLTIASTILVGRRCWEGWALAALNSVIVCFIGLKTDQLGFIPANVFCMVMSGVNLRAWLKLGSHPPALVRSPLSRLRLRGHSPSSLGRNSSPRSGSAPREWLLRGAAQTPQGPCVR